MLRSVGVCLTTSRLENLIDVNPNVRSRQFFGDCGEDEKVCALAVESGGNDPLEVRAKEVAREIEDEVYPQAFIEECLSLADDSALEVAERIVHASVRCV